MERLLLVRAGTTLVPSSVSAAEIVESVGWLKRGVTLGKATPPMFCTYNDIPILAPLPTIVQTIAKSALLGSRTNTDAAAEQLFVASDSSVAVSTQAP